MRPRREGIRSLAAIAAAAAATGGIATTASANPYAGQITVGGGTGSYTLNQAADSVVVTTGPNGTGTVLQTLSGSNVATAGQHSFTIPASDTTGAFYVTVNQNSGGGFLAPSGTNYAQAIGSPFAIGAPRGVAVNQNPGANFGRIYISNSGTGFVVQNADQTAAFGYNNAAQTAGLPVTTSLPYRITIGTDNNLYVGDNSTTMGNIYQVSPDLTGSTALFAGNSGQTAANATANNHGESLSKPFASFANGNLTITATDGYLSIPNGATAEFQGIYQYTVPTSSIPARTSTVNTSTAKPTTVLLANATTNGTTSGLNTFTGALVTDLALGPSDNRLYFIEDQSNGTAKAGLFVMDRSSNTLYDSLVVSGGATASSGGTLTGVADRLTNINSVAISPDNKYLAFIVTSNAVAPATNAGNAVIVLPLDATINGVTGLPDLAKEIYIPNAFSSTTGNGRDIVFDAADNLYAVSSGAGQMVVLSPGGATSFTTGFDGVNYNFTTNAVPEPAALGVLSLGALGLVRRRKARQDPPDSTA